MEREPKPEVLAGLMAGMEADRGAVLTTMRRLLRARLIEDELTPDERIQAQLLLREIEADCNKTGSA